MGKQLRRGLDDEIKVTIATRSISPLTCSSRAGSSTQRRVGGPGASARRGMGVSSHGLLRLPVYLERLGGRWLRTGAELATVTDLGALSCSTAGPDSAIGR